VRRPPARPVLAASPLLLLAACSAAPPAVTSAVPPPSVETLSGQVLGAQAAAEIAGAEPVEFPAMVFDGPVATAARDILLGGTSGTRVLATPRGSLDVRYGTAAHTAAGPSAVGSGLIACVFSRTAASGGYVIAGGTGAFAGAAGHGTYALVFITETQRAADGACSPSGVPVPSGDQVDFTAGGPLTAPS
jgi:hypothetical protein